MWSRETARCSLEVFTGRASCFPYLSVTLGTEPARKSIKSGISVPIKDYGVFQAAATEKAAFNREDLKLAEFLISHTAAPHRA